jgi:hypothetical protein
MENLPEKIGKHREQEGVNSIQSGNKRHVRNRADHSEKNLIQ